MRLPALLAALLLAPLLAAQQRPIFDPDDFVDPRQRERTVFISRLVAGAASEFIDDYRPVNRTVGFVHLTNSVYWGLFQVDYKHTQPLGAGSDTGKVELCGCSSAAQPIYFPTPPLPDATPAAPLPGPKETLQFARYLRWGRDATGIPVMHRYRFTWTYQPIATDVVSAATGETTRMDGGEQSFGLEADTHVRIGGRDVYGALLYTRTERTGTTDDRSQDSFAYMSRFPAVAWGDVLARATLTVGAVTDRGASGINLVNPAFEAFWRHPRSQVSFHVVWSPQLTRSGADGWQTTHQIAVFADRALYVKLVR